MLDIRGGGAAGGIGAALVAFLDAKMNSGIQVVMDAIGFEKSIVGADLIITGEGKIDNQTFQGKVIAGVCEVATKSKIPVIALCGDVRLHPFEMEKIGLLGAFSIVRGPCSLETSIENAPTWISERTEELIRLIKMDW